MATPTAEFEKEGLSFQIEQPDDGTALHFRWTEAGDVTVEREG